MTTKRRCGQDFNCEGGRGGAISGGMQWGCQGNKGYLLQVLIIHSRQDRLFLNNDNSFEILGDTGFFIFWEFKVNPLA